MIVIGILLFAALVVVHELGHFWSARRAGVEVEEFGIGFPPRLVAKRFGESKTIYSFNLIPLGGFVKLKGEADEDRRPRSFGSAAYLDKVKILIAGVAMNIVAAFVLILILCFVGLPQLISGQFSIASDAQVEERRVLIAQVINDTPAAAIGLSQGDQILAANDQPIDSSQALTDFTQSRPKQNVALTIVRDGQVATHTVGLAEVEGGKGQLGVVPFDDIATRYTWSAPVVAAGVTLQLVWLTVVGLWQFVVGLVAEGTTSPAVAGAVGPIGIFALLQNATDLGLAYVAVLIIVVSISLSVINILPLPALDGGRLALITVFRVLKKPLTKKLENAVNTAGLLALLLLVVLISYFDVKRFF